MAGKKGVGTGTGVGRVNGQSMDENDRQTFKDKLGKGNQTFDPTHYIVPGKDHNGHSTRVWCQVRPDIDYEIDVVFQSKLWPFTTKGAFVRWAIWEGIKNIQKHRPAPGSMIVVAETINETCKSSQMWQAFKNSVDTVEKSVKAFIEMGNEEEAIKLLHKVRGQVVTLEEAQWRETYMQELDKRFGHIVARYESEKTEGASIAGLVVGKGPVTKQ